MKRQHSKANRFLRKLGEVAAISGLYFLATQIGLQLHVEPGSLILFWPASGVAIAAVLLSRRGGLTGVWLGGFLVALATYSGFLPLGMTAALSLAQGCFAVLQAWVIVRLALRWIGPFPDKPDFHHFLKFTAIAAVGSMIGATGAIATGWAAQIPPVAPVGIVWLSLWFGSTIGAVIFTPFLLMLYRWFQSESIEHQLAPMIFGLGIGLSLLLFVLLWGGESQSMRAQFDNDAEALRFELQEMFDSHVHALQAAQTLMVASERVERDEFETFMRLHSSDLDVPGLVATAWAPRVTAQERAAFEAAAQPAGAANFQITEMDAAGGTVIAGRRAEYFPIAYLYPATGNESLLGLDVSSSGVAADAIAAALSSGDQGFSAPHSLTWLPGAPTGVMSFQPIYRGDRAAAGGDVAASNLAGYMIGIMRTDAILETAMAGVDTTNREVYLVDTSGSGQLLGAQPPRTGDVGSLPATSATSLRSDLPVSLSNRTWTVSTIALPGFGVEHRTALPVSAALTALTFASLLSIYISRRQHAAEILHQSQEQYRLLAENISDVIWIMDAESSRLLYVSPSVDSLIGYSPDELLSEHSPLTLFPETSERVALTMPARLAAYPSNENRTYVDEVAILRADGTQVWTEITTRYQTDAQTGRVLIYGVSRNIDERKAIEKALQRSELQFRVLFEGAAEGIIAAEVDSRSFAFVNPAICAIFGYPDVEFLQLHIEDLHPPDAHPIVLAAFQSLAKGELSVATDLPCVRSDGSLFYADIVGSTVTMDGLSYVMGFFTDITHRRRTEEALQWETSLLRALLNSIPDLVFFKDENSVYLGCNEAFEGLYGVKEASLIGKSDFDFTSPEQAAFFQAHDRAMLVSGRPQRNEEWLTFADGREALFDTLKTPLFGPHGEQRGVLGISRDITELRRVEELLRARIWLGDFATMHTLDALCREVVDQAEQLTESQIGFLHIIHIDQNEIELQTWSTNTLQTMCTADSSLTHYPLAEAGIWADCVRMGQPLLFNQYDDLAQRRGLPSGHARVSRLMTAPVVRSGQIVAILGVGNKISDYTDRDLEFLAHIATSAWDIILRKQAEDSLQIERAALARRVEERTADLSLANVELEHALRVKNEFLANMSHELRTPLNAILALSETLREQLRGPLNDHQVKAVRIIEESGQHLLALINDILDLSKLEAGKLEIHPQSLLVADICESSLVFVKQVALKKNLTVTYTQEERDLRVEADPRRLKQILVNLLNNAVKFTPSGGHVWLEVATNREQQTLRLTVRDDGIGIAPADLPRLFQPFTQLDSGLARQYEGSGLGLAVVGRLVELHNGSIRVSSEGIAGHGATFVVTLPWAEPPPAETAREAPGAASRGTPAALSPTATPVPDETRGVILVVEDNEINVQAIAEYLHDIGFQIEIARNGQEAIDTATWLCPDLILMDIQMPVLDGLTATRRLRSKAATAHTPIIALTALAMPGDRERCLAAGASDYLAKPIRLADLVAMIERWLQPAPGDGSG